MNIVGCKCLNIIIGSELNFCFVTKDQLELTTEESKDIFFESNHLRQVEKLGNISKSLPSLVETREVGSWNIHYCINCKVHSHAIHKKKGASCVIIHPTLLDEENVKRLRNSANFSKAYGLVIDIGKFIYDNDDIFYPSEMDSLMAGIKRNATEAVKKEAALIEERIKKYTEEQYYMLDVLRDRLSTEEQTLMRIVLAHYAQLTDKEDKNSYRFLDKSHDEVVPPVMTKYAEMEVNQAQLTAKLIAAVTPKKTNKQVDIDDMLLFDFDGMEDKHSDNESLGDIDSESDDASKPNDRHQSRGRSSSIKIAKSLPMDIPAFLKPKKHHTIDFDDDDDDSLPEESNIDIAASIKKLAKSVHGSEIFGDLPRPRFSTQL